MNRIHHFAAALLLTTAFLTAATAGTADQVAPAIKGKEAYKVKAAGVDKESKIPMSMMITEDGRLIVNVDDESWTLAITGKGSNFTFAASNAQFDAIENAIAADLSNRFARKFTSKSDRALLKKLEARAEELVAERDAVLDTLRVVEDRIARLLSGGGPVPADILADLRAEETQLANEATDLRIEALNNNLAIDVQRQILSPPFDVVITQDGFFVKLKLNKKETKAKLQAKFSFVATNLVTRESFKGKRTVKGKGQIISLR